MREFKSVQKWFAVKNYKVSTQAGYSEYMAIFCGILGKTPDELANVTSEEALKIQQKLIDVMLNEFGLRTTTVTFRITALHVFWRVNGVEVTPAMMGYEGSSQMVRRIRKRVNFKLNP